MNNVDLQRGYEYLAERLRFVSADCSEALERVRQEGLANPMTTDQALRFFGRCIDTARENAYRRGDITAAKYLETSKENMLTEVLAMCQKRFSSDVSLDSSSSSLMPLSLQSHEGVEPREVLPTPSFHGRQIPVREGFVDVSDIRLWDENERLKVHINQFKTLHGRAPSSDDLLNIMHSQANLTGLDTKDQFKIESLARSIAAGGVRVPPIISAQGTLLDGNRRVAACRTVLSSDEFSPEQKSRAKKIRVWQLTEHATSTDEQAVLISLNFEPSNKVEWPEYVKGRKVHEEWRAVLENEDSPSAARQAELKRELAKKFALTTDRLNRYIEMVNITDEFEEYQRNIRGKNEYEVQHRASDCFQYFDELGKGRNPGGVNYIMNQDDAFKNLVFDLLYDDKFSNFTQIRSLKFVHDNDEAKERLLDARKSDVHEMAQDQVKEGLSIAHAARAVERKVGGNKRVEVFVKWLRQVPVEFFSVGEQGAITKENLARLYEALKLVEGHIPDGLRHTK